MVDASDPRAVDEATLLQPVQQALGRNTMQLVEWGVEPLSYTHINPISDGLYRFTGTARDVEEVIPWTLILKVTRAPAASDDVMVAAAHLPSDWNYWKREFLAYQSGLLNRLPPGLVAPRCYGADEPAPDLTWLWLEPVADSYGSRWTHAQFATAARHLGQFNGAYLAGHPLPTAPWLCTNWLHSWVRTWGPMVEGLAAVVDHPLIKRGFPGSFPARVAQLWADHDHFLQGLERLPQTLCHQDAWRHNLFVRQAATGRDETVAIDWAFSGMSAIGEELSCLTTMAAVADGETDQLRELDALVYENYLTGLRDAGCDLHPDIVRLGYVTSTALRWGLGAASLWHAIEEEEFQRSYVDSIEALMDLVATLLDYLLDLADEARALHDRLL